MIIEQIYPKMWGSLKEMTQGAKEYHKLGIEAIWISPFYPHGGADGGYDVIDHCEVSPEFGTMDDFDELVETYHSLGIQVFIDLVINHCSDQNKYFQLALREGNQTAQDMFYFADQPLNDWESIFGGSVWEYKEEINKYVFHAFTKHQIDWNFDNELVWEMWNHILCHWLIHHHVDGFRIDAQTHMAKDWQADKVESDPSVPYRCAPKLESYMERLANLIHSIKPNAFLIGEANGCTKETARRWIDKHWLNCVISFEHRGAFEIDKYGGRKGNTLETILSMKEWSEYLGADNLAYIQNHDIACAYSILNLDHVDIADLLFAQNGHKIIFNFQEWGMENPIWENLGDIDEVETWDRFKHLKELGVPFVQASALAAQLSRENARRPNMKWDTDLWSRYKTCITLDKLNR